MISEPVTSGSAVLLIHVAPDGRITSVVPEPGTQHTKHVGELLQAAKTLCLTPTTGKPRVIKAVYFLHGCGYAGERVPFAWYEFRQQGRTPAVLPLVARGVGPAHSPDTPPANIQDWWPEFAQFNADGVRHVAITENGDPFAYERYLYSLEWVNPDPAAVLDEIRVRSNPVVPTTLGLLAVTLLVD